MALAIPGATGARVVVVIMAAMSMIRLTMNREPRPLATARVAPMKSGHTR